MAPEVPPGFKLTIFWKLRLTAMMSASYSKVLVGTGGRSAEAVHKLTMLDPEQRQAPRGRLLRKCTAGLHCPYVHDAPVDATKLLTLQVTPVTQRSSDLLQMLPCRPISRCSVAIGALVHWQVELDEGVDPGDVTFSWSWSVPGMALEEAVHESRTDLEYLVILPTGLETASTFTVSVTIGSLSHPGIEVTLQSDIKVHAGLIALPGGLQVTEGRARCPRAAAKCFWPAREDHRAS